MTFVFFLLPSVLLPEHSSHVLLTKKHAWMKSDDISAHGHFSNSVPTVQNPARAI